MGCCDKNHNVIYTDYSQIGELCDISKNIEFRCQRFLEIARAMLGRGITSHGRTFNCTFITQGKSLIAIGVNNYLRPMEWHPKFGRIKIFGDERYNPGLHSEIDAILKLNRDNCSNLSFFNIHLDKKLECKNSAPCRNCMAVVNRIGFKTFYFYDENLKKFVGIK